MAQNSILPGPAVYMRIDFRSEYAFVPEHFLHCPEIGPVFDEVGGKGMPERVRGDFLAHPGKRGLFLDHIENCDAAERLAEAVQESHVIIRRRTCFRPDGKVIPEFLRSDLSERHEPFLVPFADYSQKAFTKIYLRYFQGAGLRNAQTAAVKDLEYRPVPHSLPGAEVHVVDYPGDLFHGKNIGQIPPDLRGFHIVTGIVWPLPFQDKPVEIRTEGAQESGEGTLGQIPGTAGQIVEDIVPDGIGRLDARTVKEFSNVRSIGRHSMGGHPPLNLEVIRKTVHKCKYRQNDIIFADMKTKAFAALALIITGALSICSCCKTEPQLYDGPFDSVMIFYAEAYNNLSRGIVGTDFHEEKDSLRCSDLQDLCRGDIPEKDSRRAIVAYCHGTRNNNTDYTSPSSPVLIRIYRENGQAILDTVKVYEGNTVSASAANINGVLSTIRNTYKSDHYGLVYSSHASGWLPCNFYNSNKPAPALQSVGAQFDKSVTYTYEVDIKDFASAIPMKLDYIIFDACLMGGVEVAYELRKVCDRVVFSPTEIFTEGLYYRTIAKRLLQEVPDLRNVCKDYMEHYEAGATISLVDCRQLDKLASEAGKLISRYGSNIPGIQKSSVQRFYTGNHEWFYDMRSIIKAAGATVDELNELDKVLDTCIPYKDYTPEFGSGTQYYIPIREYCGLSMWLPMTKYPKLVSYYKDLDWNKAVGLVK